VSRAKHSSASASAGGDGKNAAAPCHVPSPCTLDLERHPRKFLLFRPAPPHPSYAVNAHRALEYTCTDSAVYGSGSCVPPPPVSRARALSRRDTPRAPTARMEPEMIELARVLRSVELARASEAEARASEAAALRMVELLDATTHVRELRVHMNSMAELVVAFTGAVCKLRGTCLTHYVPSAREDELADRLADAVTAHVDRALNPDSAVRAVRFGSVGLLASALAAGVAPQDGRFAGGGARAALTGCALSMVVALWSVPAAAEATGSGDVQAVANLALDVARDLRDRPCDTVTVVFALHAAATGLRTGRWWPDGELVETVLHILRTVADDTTTALSCRLAVFAAACRVLSAAAGAATVQEGACAPAWLRNADPAVAKSVAAMLQAGSHFTEQVPLDTWQRQMCTAAKSLATASAEHARAFIAAQGLHVTIAIAANQGRSPQTCAAAHALANACLDAVAVDAAAAGVGTVDAALLGRAERERDAALAQCAALREALLAILDGH
jgi:hypothetical protein